MTKKYFSMVLVSFMLLGLCACKQKLPTDTYLDPLTEGTLYYNKATKTLQFNAIFNAKPATDGAWHLIAHKDGKAGGSAVTPFSTDVTPHQFYQGLLLLGAEAGNNVTITNMGDEGVFTQGSVLDISITWDGAGRKYALSEFMNEEIPDNSTLNEELSQEIRFGGNRATEPTSPQLSDGTGCVICQYTCPIGVASGAKADQYIMKNHDHGKYRYLANAAVVPDDKTVCTITVKVQK